MRWQCSLIIAALAAAAPASPLAGQAVGDAPVVGTEQRPAAPSVAERLALPPHAAELLAPAPAVDSAGITSEIAMQRRTGRGTALAIVGGALFVGGLIAGGDAGTLMVVAGAGIGAYGLYLMLR